ncbi:hypothetical protein ASF84_23975 [Pseudomonas sp. Leaf127]|uniref:sigma factor n=1 Tax=Pseudomonas sp. Leaf127 TaxID=1736267 RepID=UPI000703C282|nr:sigma factor [Pseudomonas sp. Leaf127]KQQ66377.1 hypothetical protein ASF84_23975 [Pseudomonas sp. Leaf127]
MSSLDISAIPPLYNEPHRWLKGWLRVRSGNPADAADFARDTFLKVMGARNAGPIRQPRGYLSSVACSLLVDNA